MKRSLMVTALAAVLSLVVLGAMSCTVSDTGNANSIATNGNMGVSNTAVSNGNANTSSTGATAAADVTTKEKQLWNTIKNKEHDAFGKMLSEDSIYISSDGVYDKAGTINGVKSLAATDVTLSDWKTVMLNGDAALVTYTVDLKGTSNGQALPPGAMRASTAWVKRGAEWMAVYHQDSPVEEAPPAGLSAEASKPMSSAPAAANANTAGSSTMADDPIAKEKLIWEAFKRKDFDVLANALAEDQIEVEPSGVSDKAGTLAAVRQFDFSKGSTSDFKATKLDADATLVTYMVKAPDARGKLRDERHSTIWINRGGKWLAVFHQGTPVMHMPSR